MNKMMLASLTLLLAGASALPVAADDDKRRAGGEQSWQGDSRQGNKGRHQEVARDQRQDDRGGRQDNRQDYRGERQDDRQAYRGERQDDRQAYRGGRQDDRQEWRADNRGQRYDHRDDRRDYRVDHRDDRNGHYRDYRGGHGGYARHNDRRWHGNHWYPQYRYRAPVRYVYPPGYRAYQWRVGHRLPHGYYGRPYYVDYNYYRLPPPPYGYGWVRVDRDVVLVALATGLIIDALYGLYH